MPARRQPTAPVAIHQLRVTLKGVRPPIWRRAQVPSNISLYKLHQVIQIVMGWGNYHLYEFTVGQMHYGEPDPESPFDVTRASRAKLGQVAPSPKDRLLYLYDFGDDWEHEVRVEQILPAETGMGYPRCLTGKRACPPEDCGGIWGYAELLEILLNPQHEEYEEKLEWLGGEFDPDAFELDAINNALKRMR